MYIYIYTHIYVYRVNPNPSHIIQLTPQEQSAESGNIGGAEALFVCFV